MIDTVTSLTVLDSAGTAFESLGEGQLKEGAGVAVNAATPNGSTIYAAEAGGPVDVFGPALPSPPRIEGESFAEVTSSGATLGAQVNPHSDASETSTEYRFEYGRCASASASSCASSGYEEVPGSAGQIPADFEIHAVSATLAGLSPHTTYHFKLIARNAHNQAPLPASEGEERIFTTEGAGGELVLPDNRGWELVSPPDKQGAKIEPIKEYGVVQAAASGDGLTYAADAPTEAEPQGYSNLVQILSRRAGGAWSSRDIAIPHVDATGFAIGPGPEYKFFDPELSLAAVQPFGEFDPGLSEQASESTAYLHSLSESCGAEGAISRS